jgi:hypothetical protein
MTVSVTCSVFYFLDLTVISTRDPSEIQATVNKATAKIGRRKLLCFFWNCRIHVFSQLLQLPIAKMTTSFCVAGFFIKRNNLAIRKSRKVYN